MKKLQTIAIFAVMILSSFGRSYAETLTSAFPLTEDSGSYFTESKKDVDINIHIKCCPLKITFGGEGSAALVGNLEVDEKGGRLLVSGIRSSNPKMQTLVLARNIAIDTSEAKELGYESFVVLAGVYTIRDGKELQVNFSGKKAGCNCDSREVPGTGARPLIRPKS
jgi:hypothetical protein